MNVVSGGTLSGTATVVALAASVEKDRATFYLPDHTAKEPRLFIFTRTIPAGNGNGAEMLRGGLKTVFGDRNTDGTARSGNIIIETSIRFPQDQELAIAELALDKHFEVLRDSNIMTPLLEKGLIPYA